MAFGIIEPRGRPDVPGTVYMRSDGDQTQGEVVSNPNLKYDTTGKTPIVLVPQPSNDPNDPLNWPLWRRDLILFIVSLLAVIASTLSPLLAADTLDLSLFYRRKFTTVALLTGYHLLGVGIGGILFVPSSRIWGKRHAFLIGNIIVILSSAWGGASGRNYTSMLWARIFQGIGLAPFESLANAVVGDLYYVHQRGKRMALTNFAVFGGSFLTPVIVGKMAKEIGWPWSFYFVAIFAAVLFPFMLFFVPETAYRRDERLNTDMGTVTLGNAVLVTQPDATAAGNKSGATHGLATDGSHYGKNPDAVHQAHANHEMTPEASEKGITTTTSTPPAKVSYLQSIALFNGRKTDESFWKLFIRPFPLFFHPAIAWGMLIQGTLIGWTVFLGIVLAAIMLGPPLFFNQVKTGYMYTGAFIGALVGFLIAGITSDLVPQWMTRRNGGRYEPEFRLVIVIPQLVLGCAGLYGFGITAANTPKYGWFWPDFFFALEVAGMVCGAVASSLYIVDAHRNIAIEAFTCMIVFKNVFSFGLTFSGYDWLADHGIKHVFMWTASVQVGICLLTIPLYIFGKLNRDYFARHDILKKLGLW